MQLQVGVKALIKNSQDEYLFIRRSAALPDGSGIRWDIPGGRISAEEQLIEALTREVQEETALTLQGSPMLVSAQDILIPDKQLHVVRLTYTMRASGELNLSDEHQEYTWATLEQAIDLNVDNYLRQTLEMIR